MWRVWEAMWVWAILDEAQLDLFEHASLLGLLVGFGIEMHVGHGLGLEHDLDLGVGSSYKSY